MGRTRQSGWVFDLRPIVEEMGLAKVIEQLGKKQVIEEIGIKAILANLTPAQRRELQQHLSEESPGKVKKS